MSTRRIILRGVVAAVTLAAPIFVAPPASAHYYAAWRWSEARADFKYETRYDVELVSCSGWGRRVRSDDTGLWLYKHFDCIVYHWDGTSEEDTLHVLGRRAFVVYD